MSRPRAGHTEQGPHFVPEEVFFMKGQINPDIRCDVRSCRYHDAETGHCALEGIHVRACEQCGTGRAEDESMCGSYRTK